MRKLVLAMHTSADGYVAGPNGEFEWINVDDPIFDYVGKLTDAADTALYGRVTYDMMEGYWPTAGDQPNATAHDKHHSEWYNKVHKVVLSKTLKGTGRNKTTIISENVPEQINALKQEQGKEILMIGSPSAAHSLMQHDLIDEFWLFVNPIALGTGIPLFKNLKQHLALKLESTNVFPSGVVCMHYSLKK